MVYSRVHTTSKPKLLDGLITMDVSMAHHREMLPRIERFSAPASGTLLALSSGLVYWEANGPFQI